MTMTTLSDHLAHIGGIEKIAGVCERHGDFTSYRLRGSDAHTCPACFEESMRRQTMEQAFKDRLDRLHRVCGVPARYAGLGFNSYQQTLPEQQSAVRMLGDFWRGVRNTLKTGPVWSSLVLHGGPGTGKTHLACALVNNLVSRGIGARYVTMAAMLSDIKRAYSAPDLTEAGQIARYVDEPDLLVVDEADIIRGTENDLGLIFAVVNGRYNARKPMAVISNQPLESLAGFIGDRTVSRLRENIVLITCSWGDFRVKVVSNRNHQGE